MSLPCAGTMEEIIMPIRLLGSFTCEVRPGCFHAIQEMQKQVIGYDSESPQPFSKLLRRTSGTKKIGPLIALLRQCHGLSPPLEGIFSFVNGSNSAAAI
jgi:hypothetical protein